MEMTTNNYFGAFIFWSYIFAALFLTGFIFTSLWTLRTLHRHASSVTGKGQTAEGRRGNNVCLFTGLSVLSFSVLSYHMLFFLIDHWTKWAIIRHVHVPRSITAALTKDMALKVWEWSHTSSLFRDFARQLCDPPGQYWWTCQTLLFSFQWNIIMAVQGVRWEVPHVWAYFILGQILPTSFAQNLFFTAICLCSSSVSRGSSDRIPVPGRREQGILVGGLFAVLLGAPMATYTGLEMGVLLATRVLLAGPYLLLKMTALPQGKETRARDAKQQQQQQQQQQGWYGPLTWSAHLTLLGAAGFLSLQTVRAGGDMTAMVRSVNDSWAVSALGYDYLIGLGSLGLFVWEASDLVMA